MATNEIDGALQQPLTPAQYTGVVQAGQASILGIIPAYQLQAMQFVDQQGNVLNISIQGNTLSLITSQINAVKALIPTNLGGLPGSLAAQSVTVAQFGGENLESVLADIYSRLHGVTSSAPSLTGTPTFTGTAAVGATLTLTFGAVSEGSGGSHTTSIQIYSTAPGPTLTESPVGQPIAFAAGTTSTTYKIPSSFAGTYFSFAQTPIDSTGAVGNSKESALSALITAVTPTNSVAPSISPNGSQPAAQIYTVSVGTWSISSGTIASYGVQFYLNGVPLGGRATTAGPTTTFTGQVTYAGQTLTYDVTATSALGAVSAPVAGSNSVVFTGAAGIVATSVPVIPANIYTDTPFSITPGVWPQPVNVVQWDFYFGTMTVPFATFLASQYPTANFTVSPNGTATISQLVKNAGYSTMAGGPIKVVETITYPFGLNAVVYTATSTSVTVQAKAATVQVIVAIPTVNWTTGITNQSYQPILVSPNTGTAPFTYALTTQGAPYSVAGIFFDPNTGIFAAGIPSVATGSLPLTVTVTDSTGATASGTFTGQVSTPAAAPLQLAFTQLSGATWGIDAPNDADQAAYNANPGAYQSGSQSYAEKGVSSSGVIANNVGSSLIVTSITQLPTISNNTNTQFGGGNRYGVVTVDGVAAVRKNVQVGDSLYHQGLRSGTAYDGFNITYGVDYYMGYAQKIGPEWANLNLASGTGIPIMDTHSVAPYSSGNYNGTILRHLFANNLAGNTSFQKYWLAPITYTGGGTTMYMYNWAPNFNGWQRVIIHFRGGSSAQSPIVEIWVANGNGPYTKLSVVPVDPYGNSWTATTPWGDPLGGGGSSGTDYLKKEIYALYQNGGGGLNGLSNGYLTMYDSEPYIGSGSGVGLANAQAALVPFAIATSTGSLG